MTATRGVALFGRHVGIEPLADADLPWLYELAHRDDTVHTWRLGGRSLSPRDFTDLVSVGVRANFVVRRIEGGARIGFVQLLHEEPVQRRAALSVLLDPAEAGLAIEGVAGVVDLAFDKLDLQHLTLEVSATSFGLLSSAVEYFSMPTMTVPSARYLDGRFEDLIVGAISRDAWASLAGRFTCRGVEPHPAPAPGEDLASFHQTVCDILQLATFDQSASIDEVADSLTRLELVAATEDAVGAVLPDDLVVSWATLGDLEATFSNWLGRG